VFRYRERVVWATKGSPPNILAVLARVAEQQDSQDRSSVKRLLPDPATSETPPTQSRRLNLAITGPFSPPIVSTPPTAQRVPAVVVSDGLGGRAMAAADSLHAALARKLPSTAPSHQCYKCAGAHSADQCRVPADACISNILYTAYCCARCALPLTKIGPELINLHPSSPGNKCTGSRFFLNCLMRQPLKTISSVFRSGNLEQQLELLASFLSQPPH
jgi:hypothetical protein